ncbi:hypothetical protein VNO78_30830 [Psophocarpus tetragonolobus]
MEVHLLDQVEEIIGYNFQRKHLLEQALTHSSFSEAISYERLEFLGDSNISIVIDTHLYNAYPNLSPSHLTDLHKANVCTEKLARVAIRLGLHHFVRQRGSPVFEQVDQFVDAIAQECQPVWECGSMKAPKVLADIVESIIGAVYIDTNHDLNILSPLVERILEPIVTANDLFPEINKKVPINMELRIYEDEDGNPTVEKAKHKLQEVCAIKKWPQPVYKREKESGPPHKKRYVSSVQIIVEDDTLKISGYEKCRVNNSENSAASLMLIDLQERNYL